MAGEACENDYVLVFAEPCRSDASDYEIRLSCWKQDAELTDLVR